MSTDWPVKTQPYNRFNWASEIGNATLLSLPAVRGDNGIGGGPREEPECPLDKPRECGPGGPLSRQMTWTPIVHPISLSQPLWVERRFWI